MCAQKFWFFVTQMTKLVFVANMGGSRRQILTKYRFNTRKKGSCRPRGDGQENLHTSLESRENKCIKGGRNRCFDDVLRGVWGFPQTPLEPVSRGDDIDASTMLWEGCGDFLRQASIRYFGKIIPYRRSAIASFSGIYRSGILSIIEWNSFSSLS